MKVEAAMVAVPPHPTASPAPVGRDGVFSALLAKANVGASAGARAAGFSELGEFGRLAPAMAAGEGPARAVAATTGSANGGRARDAEAMVAARATSTDPQNSALDPVATVQIGRSPGAASGHASLGGADRAAGTGSLNASVPIQPPAHQMAGFAEHEIGEAGESSAVDPARPRAEQDSAGPSVSVTGHDGQLEIIARVCCADVEEVARIRQAIDAVVAEFTTGDAIITLNGWPLRRATISATGGHYGNRAG